MYRTKSSCWVGLRRATLALLAIGSLAVQPLRADVVYVTTYIGAAVNATTFFNDPLGLGPSYSASGSTAIANPPGVPSRTKCVYYYGQGLNPNWLIVPPLGVDGGVYSIEVAHTALTTSPDVVVTAYCADNFYGQTSAGCTNSAVFNAANGGNTWKLMGYITNAAGITDPEIIFKQVGGVTGPGSNEKRLYVDAFKFTLIDVCAGVVGDLSVNGPLAAGQMFVTVSGVTAGATNVTIFANDAEIGQTNLAAGFAAGALSVPVNTGLVKGNIIKATQKKPSAAPEGYCVSPLPADGPLVGSGANPALKVVLSCGAQSALTGPAGADTSGAATTLYHVNATGLAGGSATAPVGGVALVPGSCWQTVTFDFATDPMLNWMAGTAYSDSDPFCTFDALSFAIDPDNPDTGPYDIYVDKIMNGDVVIEDFEGWEAGDSVMFAAPNATGVPDPAIHVLGGGTTSSVISQANAYEGTNSCRIRWQFKNEGQTRWVRVLASKSNGATYPQLDKSKPVTLRLLVLPVGETTAKLGVGPVASQTKAPGESVTFSVVATGVGPFSYQWKHNGSNVGTDSSSYTIGSVSAGDAGNYTVVVSNAACDPIESSPGVLTVSAPAVEPVKIDSITATTIAYSTGAGTQFILLKAAAVNAPMNTWVPVATNNATPGTFAVPGPGFYRIESK